MVYKALHKPTPSTFPSTSYNSSLHHYSAGAPGGLRPSARCPPGPGRREGDCSGLPAHRVYICWSLTSRKAGVLCAYLFHKGKFSSTPPGLDSNVSFWVRPSLTTFPKPSAYHCLPTPFPAPSAGFFLSLSLTTTTLYLCTHAFIYMC